jgi:hypothetical protein
MQTKIIFKGEIVIIFLIQFFTGICNPQYLKKFIELGTLADDSSYKLISVSKEKMFQVYQQLVFNDYSQKTLDIQRNPSKYNLVSLRKIISTFNKSNLISWGWDPKEAAHKVMDRLIKVTGPEVKGAHDAHFVIVDNKAYITYMANDIQPGESPQWPFVYNAMSIIDINNLKVEKILPMATGGQIFKNEILPEGACFVPRILKKDPKTLRCFFASENPGKRQSQIWYVDFDLRRGKFKNNIFKARLQTGEDILNMQPNLLYQKAVEKGYNGSETDYGMYPFDIKTINNKLYVGISHYPVGPSILTTLNRKMNTFNIESYLFIPNYLKLNETAFNCLPDGTWLAIVR